MQIAAVLRLPLCQVASQCFELRNSPFPCLETDIFHSEAHDNWHGLPGAPREQFTMDAMSIHNAISSSIKLCQAMSYFSSSIEFIVIRCYKFIFGSSIGFIFGSCRSLLHFSHCELSTTGSSNVSGCHPDQPF